MRALRRAAPPRRVLFAFNLLYTGFMAHSATLYLEGSPIAVQEFHWAIVQLTDLQSRPQAGILAGKISLVIDKLQHAVIDAWMADPAKRLDGSVVVKAADGMGAVRTLRFVDALCVSQGLSFTAGGDGTYAGTMSVLLTARQLHVNEGLTLDNHWPDQ